MGWDGNGQYTRVHNFSADASAGIKILASRMDAEIDDVASAFSRVWTRDGQNTPTTDLPMGGRKFVNVGAPTSVNNFMRSREFIENVPIFMTDAETSADRISVSAQYFTSVSANQAPGDGTRVLIRMGSDKSSAAFYLNGHSANVEFQDGNRANAAMVSGGIYEMIFSSVDVAWKVTAPDDGRTAAERSAGVTPLSLRIESHATSGVINVFRYMTIAQIGDVVSRGFTLDVSGAINNAISVARTLAESLGGATVYLPAGTYRVESAIAIPHNNPDLGPLTFRGAGKGSTIIKSSGITNKVLTIGDLTQQTIRGCIQDLCIDGNDQANYCIYGPRCEEHDFVRVWCRNSNVSGMSIGYGYVNNYHEVDCSYNNGHGLELNIDFGSANNANVLTGCLLFSNDGLGLKAVGGNGLWVLGCTIEQNKQGGALIASMGAVYIKSYFEGNGLTGYTFASPSQTVKADIIFAGSGATQMSSAFPVTGVVIESCITDPRATSDAFVWNGGVSDLVVKNCTTTQPSYVPVVAENYTPAEKGSGLNIQGCSTFDTQLEIINIDPDTNNTNAARVSIRGIESETERRNYALIDMNQWTLIAGGASTTFRRSQTAGKKKFRGNDVWEFVKAASGTGDQMGFTLSATEYPDLSGQLMWFGLWVNQAASDNYVQPGCSEQAFNNNPNATVGTWTLLGVSFIWPASGTITLGALIRGAASSGSSYISSPMLAQVGVPHDEAVGLNTKNPRQWMGSAVPTTGAWEAGDIVWNTAPSAGGAPGWSCVTAGSPGTWKAMANLAA